MGDNNAPDEFCESFQEAVSEWNSHRPVADSRMYVKCPFGGGLHDGSITVYADDIWKKLMIDSVPGVPLQKSAVEKVGLCNAALDDSLSKRSYAQNISEQVVVPDLRENLANRELYRADVRYKVMVAHRHLGGQYTAMPSNIREIRKRIAAGNRAWAEGAGFWHRSGAPWRVKRTCCRMKVQGSVLSGMVAYVLNASD